LLNETAGAFDVQTHNSLITNESDTNPLWHKYFDTKLQMKILQLGPSRLQIFVNVYTIRANWNDTVYT